MTSARPGWTRRISPPLLLAFLFFILYVVFDVFQKKIIDNDTCLWIRTGLQIFQGDLTTLRFYGDVPAVSPLVYAPGFPFLIGLTNLVFGDPIFCARLVSLLAAAATLLVIYGLAKEIFGPRIGLIALIFSGVYTPLVNSAATELPVSTAVFFFVLSAYAFVLSFRRKGAFYPLAAGIAGGLAVLTRFEYALYIVLFAVLLVWKIRRRRVPFPTLVLFGAAAAFVYGLYAVPLYLNSGYVLVSPSIGGKIRAPSFPEKPHPNAARYLRLNETERIMLFNRNTASTATLAVQNRVRVSAEDWEKFGAAEGRDPALRSGRLGNYAVFFKRYAPKLFRLYLLPLLLLGTVHVLRGKGASSGILFLLVGVTIAVFPLGNVDTDRYFFPVIPLLLILASAGILELETILRTFHDAGWILPAMIVLLVGGFVANDIRSLVFSFTPQDRAWLKSGEYLRTRASAEDIVMSRKRYPAFFGGLKISVLPDENLEDVWEYARFIGADYLVVDRGLTAALMPQYERLLGDALPSCLEPAAAFFPGTADETRVLKFRWDRP